MIWFASFAFADVSTPTPTDTAPTGCEAEGDACTLSDGGDGVCDADLTCVADKDDDSKGCSTTGGTGAAAMVGLALGVLALRPRR